MVQNKKNTSQQEETHSALDPQSDCASEAVAEQLSGSAGDGNSGAGLSADAVASECEELNGQVAAELILATEAKTEAGFFEKGLPDDADGAVSSAHEAISLCDLDDVDGGDTGDAQVLPETPPWLSDGPWPFITVVMPVRNEERFIADTLCQLVRQQYPTQRYEILVADGMSTDATPSIVRALAKEFPQIQYVENHGIRSAAGRNAGFRQGRGDIFLVVDGHCHIPDAKLLHNVAQCMHEFEVDCLGRPQPLDAPDLSSFQQAVALARASRIGHGADSLIYSDYEGPASPVSNGAAYTRAVFEKIGYVDERFDACEDVEFNYRVEQAGFQSATSPRLTVRYYPREDVKSLWRQMVRYGEGRYLLWRVHPETLSWAARMPALFTAGVLSFPLCVLFAFAGWKLPVGLWQVGVVLYALAVFAASAIEAQHGAPVLLKRLPVIFATIHLGLGFGFLRSAARELRAAYGPWKASKAAGLRHRMRKMLRVPEQKPRSDDRIRVGMIIDRIESPTAGTEKQLLMLIEGLDRSRFAPVLYVLQDSQWLRSSFSLCPVRVADIPSFKPVGAWRNVRRMAQWFVEDEIDILQMHFRDATIAGSVAARLARVPRVISMRKNQGYWQNYAERILQRVLNRWAHRFVANSHDTALRAQKSEKLPEQMVTVIPNGFAMDVVLPPIGALEGSAASGISCGEEKPAGQHEDAVSPREAERQTRKRAARELLGLSLDVPVAGIVANLRPVKSHEVFLKAAAKVRKKLPQVRFVLIGDGDRAQDLRLLVRKLKLNDSVLFAGRRPDVTTLLPAFDIGVLSSRSESFSNALIEYMAAGLPVVATDVGGVREALAESSAGRIVPVGNVRALSASMLALLTDEAAAQRAAEEHPRIVHERFSAVGYVAAYESLYAQLMNEAAAEAENGCNVAASDHGEDVSSDRQARADVHEGADSAVSAGEASPGPDLSESGKTRDAGCGSRIFDNAEIPADRMTPSGQPVGNDAAKGSGRKGSLKG
ncbi:glycosyltransferase [Oleidesulfovibrio sp.]|uniref:glycosyltransferase n=1 Tax=Oleidesulfovibrio sp. TaxID=2909707 RepID=UPI003A884366